MHRVMAADGWSPQEFALLVTTQKLILIRQKKTRSALVLRGEIRWGSEVGSPVVPKTLADYEGVSTEALVADPVNVTIANDSVTEVRLVRGAHRYHVHHIDLSYRADSSHQKHSMTLYLVPLGAYLKPRRTTQSREDILREYAVNSVKTLQDVLPAAVKFSGESSP